MSISHGKSKFQNLPRAISRPLECPLEGPSLLHSSAFNKGSAFPAEERKAFKLHGLLPPNIQTLDEQVRRAYEQYSSRQDDLAKNTFMASMKMQSEVLYYRLLQDHFKEMFGVIYTPTEGDAIQNYSRLFRRPEGCFLNITDQDRIEECLSNFGGEDVDYIVVSDGEEILGIGDQGVGAILISTAKLVITTLCAGIHPSRQLPVVLDCGTNNETLLNDELYLGLRQPRARGKEYDEFLEKFVTIARKRFPKAYIHFEDFGLQNAKRVLDKYRSRAPCFNDDIQGTGCVTLAAIIPALQVSNVKLSDARFVMFGSGTAGTGIADQICGAIANETGKCKEEAAKQIWCLDKQGLLLKSQGNQLTAAQVPYARNDSEWDTKETPDLLSVVKTAKPHVLVGTSTKPKSFTEEVIREMAKNVESPIVLPLSNPTRLHEADPHDINTWTDGRALMATGSPFPPVDRDGGKYEIAECNNSTCFPGIGLGVVLSRARVLSDRMLVAAVSALAARSPALKDAKRPLLPDVEEARSISVDIAKAVIQTAMEEGHAEEKGIPTDPSELEEWIQVQMWDPVYHPLKKV